MSPRTSSKTSLAARDNNKIFFIERLATRTRTLTQSLRGKQGNRVYAKIADNKKLWSQLHLFRFRRRLSFFSFPFRITFTFRN